MFVRMLSSWQGSPNQQCCCPVKPGTGQLSLSLSGRADRGRCPALCFRNLGIRFTRNERQKFESVNRRKLDRRDTRVVKSTTLVRPSGTVSKPLGDVYADLPDASLQFSQR